MTYPHLTHPITELHFSALRAAQARAHIHADTPDVVVDGSGWHGPRTVIAARVGDAFLASEADWLDRLAQREIDNYWGHLPRDAQDMRALAEYLDGKAGVVRYETYDENDEQTVDLLDVDTLVQAGFTETLLYSVRRVIGWQDRPVVVVFRMNGPYRPPQVTYQELRRAALDAAVRDETRYAQAVQDIRGWYARLLGD